MTVFMQEVKGSVSIKREVGKPPTAVLSTIVTRTGTIFSATFEAKKATDGSVRFFGTYDSGGIVCNLPLQELLLSLDFICEEAKDLCGDAFRTLEKEALA